MARNRLRFSRTGLTCSMAGYCFRCDAPAEGEVCSRCGSPVYREEKKTSENRRRTMTIGEAKDDRPAAGPRAIVTIVAIVLLLVAIAVVATSAAGVS